MAGPQLESARGLLETHGLTPAMVAIDAMAKSAPIRVVQVELNDLCGVAIQIDGPVAEVQIAIGAGRRAAEKLTTQPVIHQVITRAAEHAEPGMRSRPEYNPLIQQEVVFAARPAADLPHPAHPPGPPSPPMNNPPPQALGFVETQGFTAVIDALDTACKTANVSVVGKEKLGGGYVTVVIQGELSAVTAAIEAGRARVEGLGKLIAAHVIARPSEAVLSLLPRL